MTSATAKRIANATIQATNPANTPERAAVQAQARADYLSELATKAAQAAAMTADDVRQAQRLACDVPGGQPLELLLREALADAVKLADRLALLASFTRGDD